jgi:hypothetical protein
MFNKLFFLFLISSVKFVFAFPLALRYDFPFSLTLLVTTSGGVAGVLFFAFLSEKIIVLYLWFIHKQLIKFPKTEHLARSIKQRYLYVFPKKQKKIFSNRSKRYVKLKQNFGLGGIAMLTPLILSIPLGTFLAIRFYKRTNKTILTLCMAVLFWSIVFSLIVHYTDFRY